MLRYLRNSILEKKVKSNAFFLYISNLIIENFKFLLPYEEDWLFFKEYEIDKKSIILDIGSHWGESAITFGKYYSNRIFSFEPNPLIFSKLKKNTKNLNIKTFNYGIGKKHKSNLYFPSINNNLLSLWASDNLNLLKKRIEEYTFLNSSKIEYKKIKCHFKPLPKINNSISIIKIDVEGAEYFVIKAISHIIKREYPLLFIEFNSSSFENLYKYLIRIGYMSFVYEKNKLIKNDINRIKKNRRLKEKRTLNVIFKKK